MINSYYIDDNNVLHTYIDNVEHVTISEVYTDKQAEELIGELNSDMEVTNVL